MKKFYSMFIVMLLAMTMLLAGCGAGGDDNGKKGNGDKKSDLSVGMVTDTGGVNDNSFNQSAWEGLQQLSEETGAKVEYLQSTSDADYIPNLNQFVKDGWDLTWGIGFMMGEHIKTVADENPDSKLAIIDAVVDAPNVSSITFKEHEGSYLVGVVAGLVTKTNKIGFVGGADIPVIKRFEAGFIEGVKAVNPDAEVIVNYTGKFDAPQEGKAAAATIYNDGADIIFHAAGSTGDGVFGEANERSTSDKKVWVIGVDRDQSLTFGNEITLTSMMKRVDEAVHRVSNDLAEGNFKSGIVELGLKENAVGLPEENPNVPEDVLKKVEEYKEKIVNGEISVPETPAE